MLNNITIMGRLTADPELRTTSSGREIASFTVAVDRDFKQNGETVTDFIRCQAWASTATFVGQYFAKGRLICVNGRLQSRNYEDKNGNKRTAWEVIADRVWFCGDRAQERGQATTQATQDAVEEVSDDDLPF